MIDGRNFFSQPVRNDIRKYENIRKSPASQGDDYTTSCLLDYPFFRENYNGIIATDLSKQQAFDADSKPIQQVNFTGNIDRTRNAIMFFVLEEVKETILDFSQGTMKAL